MATVYVKADRAREFGELFDKWKRERFGARIVTQPPEGPPFGDEAQFVMVDDAFLPYLRSIGFPFRVE